MTPCCVGLFVIGLVLFIILPGKKHNHFSPPRVVQIAASILAIAIITAYIALGGMGEIVNRFVEIFRFFTQLPAPANILLMIFIGLIACLAIGGTIFAATYDRPMLVRKHKKKND